MQLMCCVRRSLSAQLKSNLKTRQFCLKTCKKQLEVGVLCDIDGVLVRGRTLITGARESVRLLYDHDIPVVFLTNQVLQLEKDKAENLSRILDLKVHPDQVVMSHSPLRLYKDLFEKFVLVLGQLDVQAVASSIGFKNICDIEDVRRAYPLLDMMDKEKRYENLDKYGRKNDFPNIEGIVLLGEPIKWECVLQLCMDLLVSDGNPSRRLPIGKVEHMPVVACNPDLTWMAEAPLPRFGHGAFLLCLESLFKKITGNELKYTTITGKPFLTTFKYAERVIRDILAKANGSEMSKSLKRIYVIG
ncbi:haloacid dehalogenase-like hydrolase domain-containing 5 isoform X2 [Xenia sp. Carnegie-2017]|nr:haloacid dehalogenase-like hydrolase domain-containing 5 isoform X2 [Xenia sp. Carnegie-2017]